MNLAVFASSTASPVNPCKDAALPDSQLSYPQGTKWGQAGWNVGIGFSRAATLPANLSSNDRIKGNLIYRLAINAHGDPGIFDLDSQATGPLVAGAADVRAKMLSADTFDPFREPLEQVGRLLTTDAVVLLVGCNVARGEGGSRLLEKLSRLWPGRTVVGFTTIGVSLQRIRAGEGCQTPGMRDTEFESPSSDEKITFERYGQHPGEAEPRLYKYVWAHEASPHAKVYKNGQALRDPEPKPGRGPEFIVGTWEWNLKKKPDQLKPTEPELYSFTFRADKTVSGQGFRTDPDNGYARRTTGARSPGKWWVEGGLATFEFDDDPPGWKRRFTVTRMEQTAKVNTVIPGRKGEWGNFEMIKITLEP